MTSTLPHLGMLVEEVILDLRDERMDELKRYYRARIIEEHERIAQVTRTEMLVSFLPFHRLALIPSH